MSTPIMFNRRLAKNELDIWLEWREHQTDFGLVNRDLARDYLSLEETMSFVTSIGENVIGGTVIYRDRTRLGMLLASVSVKEAYRDTGAYSIVKSSLPFFRSVAIRDVDALVPNEKTERKLGFPCSLELDWWTRSILERIGFEEQENIYSYTLSIPEAKSGVDLKREWDSKYDPDTCKKLIWELSKSAGLTNSHIWTAFDLAKTQGTLRTITREDSMKALTGVQPISDTAILSPLLIDDQEIELLKDILNGLKVKKIVLPLVGTGQIKMIESICDELGGTFKRRTMTLMRKHL